MKLLGIVLENFRHHEYLEFYPTGEGITSISGPSGSGKSSVVDACAWCLFGTRPAGVSSNQKLVREAVAGSPDSVTRVRVEFSVGERTFRASRWLKGAKAYGSLHEFIDNDWVEIAGTSVSHVNDAVREVLRLTPQGFFTAIMVQQKQVDNIVTSTPQKRGEIIEKLTGISAISHAVKKASQEAGFLTRQLKNFTIDPSELEDSERELKKVDSSLGKLRDTFEDSKKGYYALKEQWEDIKREVTAFEERASRARDSESLINRLSGEISALEENLVTLAEEKDAHKKFLHSLTLGDSLAETEEKYQQVVSRLGSLKEEARANRSEHDSLMKRLKELDDALENKPEGSVDRWSTGLKTAEKGLEGAKENMHTVEAQVESYRRAISVISSHAPCPTCLQKVSDVSGTVEFLKKELHHARSVVAQWAQTGEEFVESIERAQVGLYRAKNYEENVVERENVANRVSECAQKETKLSEKLRSIEVEEELLKKQLVKLREVDAHRVSYDRALKKMKKISYDIEERRAKKDGAVRKSADMGVSEKQGAKLRARLEVINKKYVSAHEDMTNMSADLRVLDAEKKAMVAQVERLRKEHEKYQDMLVANENALYVRNVLEEFRENRMRVALPTLEAYASDLLHRFTEGKFIALRLDEKFYATVELATGGSRPVGLLSGGELSATALAIRLAISMLLTEGENDSLLILDEVLVSQDADRAQVILHAIQEVFAGQVIFISHSDNVDAVADTTMRLST